MRLGGCLESQEEPKNLVQQLKYYSIMDFSQKLGQRNFKQIRIKWMPFKQLMHGNI